MPTTGSPSDMTTLSPGSNLLYTHEYSSSLPYLLLFDLPLEYPISAPPCAQRILPVTILQVYHLLLHLTFHQKNLSQLQLLKKLPIPMMHPQVFSQQYQLLLLVLSTVSNSQVCHHHTNHYLLRTHKSNLSHFQPFLPVTLPAKISQVLQQYSHCIFHQGILPLFILLLPVASQ